MYTNKFHVYRIDIVILNKRLSNTHILGACTYMTKHIFINPRTSNLTINTCWSTLLWMNEGQHLRIGQDRPNVLMQCFYIPTSRWMKGIGNHEEMASVFFWSWYYFHTPDILSLNMSMCKLVTWNYVKYARFRQCQL